jgi:radical SAM protein with 4Fe4S-binding SPASM domain
MEKTKNSGITYDNIDRRDIFRNCAGGKTSCCINPYGELLLCSTLPVPRYNVLEQGFKDCWESLTGFVDGFKPGKGYKCPGCSLSAYCSFCPAMSFLETGYYDSCVLFKKQLAEINSSINSKNEDYIA